MKKETRLSIVIHRLSLPRASGLDTWHQRTSSNERMVMQRTRNGLLATVMLMVMIGCGNPDDSGSQPRQEQLPNVKIAQALSQEVTEWDEYTGRIEAVNSVDVRARVSGYLDKVNFKAGDRVNEGDLLFLIDPKPFTAQLNYAEAELERAKSKHELAKNDLLRAERLFRVKAISEEEHDARSKGLRETLAAVESAKATVYTARLNLEFTQVRSPISGRIGRELITAGNLVNGGGGDATLLTFIVSTDPVYVYVNADERSVLKYRRQAKKNGRGNLGDEQTPVELAVADELGFPHQGHLDYISPREDTATGTLSLRGVFANPDELLSPGFFARMRVRASAPYRAILLPDRAIGTDLAQRFIWVVNQENQVEYRKVVLGAHIGESRVIVEGLMSEEWAVIEGIQKLKPGIKVNPERISLTGQKAEK
ncbi:MAG: efflux RND transporter periplasmic adaptor subunit [Methylobacter sp.]|uniref:Efflux RND transporter periplasmic adaptor subunit n=1 Tax=Candidatus Methylobacter titanis TaxID=3053457 RepID=A0AA43Q4Q8_9GAMM|nr:efflux RND transporter periplasmic adaptor subunit [Candidatus Methylobacter titanis]MDI1292250.1 efflux RND transporter periplasmic adaptor subunit [Candidatus Methylobacter titanis]